MKWLGCLVGLCFLLANCGVNTSVGKDGSLGELVSGRDASEKTVESSPEQGVHQDTWLEKPTQGDLARDSGPVERAQDIVSEKSPDKLFDAVVEKKPEQVSPPDSAPDRNVVMDRGAREEKVSPERTPTTDGSVKDSTPRPCAWAGAVGPKSQVKEVTEASGLAASRQNPGVFWTHNDSGGKAEVYGLDSKGRHVATLKLSGISANDYEDIAMGPGPKAGSHYIYVADIGDNSVRRTSIFAYRLLEPSVKVGQAFAQHTVNNVEKIELKYPSTRHNAESLMIDKNGDLYVVIKNGSGPEEVYVSRAPQDTAKVRTLTKVATLEIGKNGVISSINSFSGGDISPDGSQIVLRTEEDAFVWQRSAGESVAMALGRAPCRIKMLPEPNGEAITFDLQGHLFTISEGKSQPLIEYIRK